MQTVHLVIGIFDGIHLGHRALLKQAIESAHAYRQTVAVLTFHPHPRRVLRLPNAPRLIYPIHQRCYLLRRLGFGNICVQPFSEAFASLTPEAFFDRLLRQFPTLTAVSVGEDYRFGKRCCGDVTALEALCRKHGIALFVCPNLKENGEKISSTRIRKALSDGAIDVANHFLSEPCHCIGLVKNHPNEAYPSFTKVTGNAGEGSEELFFHTHNELQPKDGVYRCMLSRKHGQQVLSVRLENGQIRFGSRIDPVFRCGVCVLFFEKKL